MTALRRTLFATALTTLPAVGLALDLGPATAAPTVANPTLVGVGRLPADTLDGLGETAIGFSDIEFDASSWSRSGDTYTGTLFGLPDRGFNIGGTTDFEPRFHTFGITFTPFTGAGPTTQDQLQFNLTATTRFTESLGGPQQFFTGLDPVPGGLATGGARQVPGLPLLPQAKTGELSLDPEDIAQARDGSVFVGDEYGPSIYRFTADGAFVDALPVPDALIPVRGPVGTPVVDFSSNNPPVGDPPPSPTNPRTGRQNNQGLEGLTISPDGDTLIAVLQSATRQDGGTGGSSSTRDTVRVLTYDLTDLDNPVLTGHYALQLPKFTDAGTGNTLVAAQSAAVALSDSRFLILPRDGNGRGDGRPTSDFRQVFEVDLTGATNLLGTAFETAGTPVAPGGVLDPSVIPASLVFVLDINDDAELARFGLQNGPDDNENNLASKWEGFALVPALDPDNPDDFFLFISNDNDFQTTNGFQAGELYDAGVDNDPMILVYRITVTPAPASVALLAVGLLGVAATRRWVRPAPASV